MWLVIYKCGGRFINVMGFYKRGGLFLNVVGDL